MSTIDDIVNKIGKNPAIRAFGLYEDYDPDGIHKNTIYLATDLKKIYFNGDLYGGEDIDLSLFVSKDDIKEKIITIRNLQVLQSYNGIVKVDLNWIKENKSIIIEAIKNDLQNDNKLIYNKSIYDATLIYDSIILRFCFKGDRGALGWYDFKLEYCQYMTSAYRFFDSLGNYILIDIDINKLEVIENNLATKDDLNNKVDKESGKSLVEDTDISKLKALPTNEQLNNRIENSATVLSETWEAQLVDSYNSLNTNKVDKVDGKDLSTNDFTDEDKAKIDSIETIPYFETYQEFCNKILFIGSNNYPNIICINTNDESFKIPDDIKSSNLKVYLNLLGGSEYEYLGEKFTPVYGTILVNSYRDVGDLGYSTEYFTHNSYKYIIYNEMPANLASTGALYDKIKIICEKINDYTDEDKEKVDSIEVIPHFETKTKLQNALTANFHKYTSFSINIKDSSFSSLLPPDTYTVSDKLIFTSAGSDKEYGPIWNAIVTNSINYKTYVISILLYFNPINGSVDSLKFHYKQLVNQIDGKQLSTEDFTTTLKEKLESLTNYDDTDVKEQINELVDRLNTLVDSDDVNGVIDTFNEIEAFLQGITDNQTLVGLLLDYKSLILNEVGNTYLPRSGGTIYGDNNILLTLKNDSGNIKLAFRDADISTGYIANDNTGFYLDFPCSMGSGKLGIFAENYNAVPKFNDYKLLHEGNYSSTIFNGTSSLFLKADGSVDDETNYIPNGKYVFYNDSMDTPLSIKNNANHNNVYIDYYGNIDYLGYTGFNNDDGFIVCDWYNDPDKKLKFKEGNLSVDSLSINEKSLKLDNNKSLTYDNKKVLTADDTKNNYVIAGDGSLIEIDENDTDPDKIPSNLGVLNMIYDKAIEKPYNGTSSLFLKADGSVDSTEYLPTTGGTIKNTKGSSAPLKIESNNSNLVAAQFMSYESNKAYVGWNNTLGGSTLFNYASQTAIGVKDDGTPFYGYRNDSDVFETTKLWHAANDGSGSGLDADLWDGEHLSSFKLRKNYTLDLSSLSNSNFYPVTFGGNQNFELDCEINSPSYDSTSSYNLNHIHFLLTANGWTDLAKTFVVLSQGNYSNSEITIGSIGYGTKQGNKCVWLRGGFNYKFISNVAPTLRTTDYVFNDEKYTVGTNLYGGTNSNVTLVWTNDSTRKNANVALISDNVASADNASKLNGYQTTLLGVPSKVPVVKENGNLQLRSLELDGVNYTELNSEGWYRVFTSSTTNSATNPVLLEISRVYSNNGSENYMFAISVTCPLIATDISNGKYVPTITQLSGSRTTSLIDKIRVVHKYNSIFYIDIHYNVTNKNKVRITGIGQGTFTPPDSNSEIPEGYTTYEFNTTTGFACNSKINNYDFGVNNGNISTYTNFPVLSTLKSLGYLPSDHDQNDTESFLKAICKWSNDTYANKDKVILQGSLTPNSSGYCIIYLYSNEDKNSEGNPKYCNCTYYNIHGLIHRFGYNNYVWFYKQIANITSNVSSADKINYSTISNGDLNLITTVGFTHIYGAAGNTCTNKPTGVASFSLLSYGASANTSTQILTSLSNNKIYKRVCYGGNWTEWAELATTDGTIANANKLGGYESSKFAFIINNINFKNGIITENEYTTEQFLSRLAELGAFLHPYTIINCSWNYSNNGRLTDTGYGIMEMAGTTIETFTSFNITNNTTIPQDVIIRVTTQSDNSGYSNSSCINSVFIYRNISNTKKNWKRLANTTDNVESANKLKTILLASNTDLNDIKDTNFTTYYANGTVSSTVLNKPSSVGDGTAFGLHVIRTADGYITQKLINAGSIIFLRTWNGSQWGSWKRVSTTEDAAPKLTTKQLTNEDLNTIKSKEFVIYFAIGNNTCTNLPSEVSNSIGFRLEIYGESVTYCVQRLTTSAGKTYIRTSNTTSSGWTAWKKMLTEDDAAPKLTTNKLTNEDLNTIKSKEFISYYANGSHTCSNLPSSHPTNVGFELQVFGESTSYCTQILTFSNGKVYKRVNQNGTWSTWKKMLTEDDAIKADSINIKQLTNTINIIDDFGLYVGNSSNISGLPSNIPTNTSFLLKINRALNGNSYMQTISWLENNNGNVLLNEYTRFGSLGDWFSWKKISNEDDFNDVELPKNASLNDIIGVKRRTINYLISGYDSSYPYGVDYGIVSVTRFDKAIIQTFKGFGDGTPRCKSRFGVSNNTITNADQVNWLPWGKLDY